MKLKPGKVKEYQKRHHEIWPELKALLKKSGVAEYAIFYDSDTEFLFAFQKVSGEGGSQDLGNEEVVQRWWKYMADIMEVNVDNSPKTTSLEEVFYLK